MASHASGPAWSASCSATSTAACSSRTTTSARHAIQTCGRANMCAAACAPGGSCRHPCTADCSVMGIANCCSSIPNTCPVLATTGCAGQPGGTGQWPPRRRQGGPQPAGARLACIHLLWPQLRIAAPPIHANMGRSWPKAHHGRRPQMTEAVCRSSHVRS